LSYYNAAKPDLLWKPVRGRRIRTEAERTVIMSVFPVTSSH
jgi:hypothetical protein